MPLFNTLLFANDALHAKAGPKRFVDAEQRNDGAVYPAPAAKPGPVQGAFQSRGSDGARM